MAIKEIKNVMKHDEYLCDLSVYIINSWPSARAKVKHEICP